MQLPVIDWPASPSAPLASKCGTCTACCTICRVVSLDKPHGVRCAHEGPVGCSIYADRPHDCQQFECAYYSGLLDHPDLRPDKCGLMFEDTWVKLEHPDLPDGKVHFLVGQLLSDLDAVKAEAATELLCSQLKPGYLIVWITPEEEQVVLSYSQLEFQAWEQFLRNMKANGEVFCCGADGKTNRVTPQGWEDL